MDSTQINILFERLSAANPAPKTELDYQNPFTLLIAVMLSAQMTDKGVNKATTPLFVHAHHPQAFLDLGEEKLLTYLKTINLYPTKTRNILKTCRLLVDQYQGHVPNTREALEALPGVGHKTASVILNIVFGQPTIAVDTHIFRVANRTGLATGTTPFIVEQQLGKVVPTQWIPYAHHWLLLHGRYICKARTPLCATCPIQDLCAYYQNHAT